MWFSRLSALPPIVGYASNNLADGNVLVSAQFLPVGGGDYDIQNIKANGTDVETYVTLQTLTTSGKRNEMFSWDTWLYVEPGDAKWIDDQGIATRKFLPGEALWVSGQPGYTLQTCGEVGTSDVVVALADGNVAVGNPFPVEVAIQDIVATGADIETYVTLQTLTTGGKRNEMFSWDTWLYVEPGDAKWIDDQGVATRKFQPGEGIWVSGQAGYTLRIPAPTLGN